ncbi:MAG: 3',5'-cyclic-nucleotide phosphodiesterase [Nitrospirales bacterium]
MKIRVLGSHGSDLLVKGATGTTLCRSVGFLINDEIMVDAGTLASGLTLEEQRRVTHILLSHLHHDHIKGIPPMVDNLSGMVDHQVVVASVPSVIGGLQKHIFNDIVFPNFFNIQGPRHSILRVKGLEPHREVAVSGEVRVTPILVNHTVETVGYVIRDDTAAWIYSGDTHLTEEIWQVAARTSNLKGVFIEVSFPNAMLDIAIQSKHLTPALLAQEFQKIGKPDLPVFVYHMKPTVRDQIIQEVAQLDIKRVTILEEGQEIEL